MTKFILSLYDYLEKHKWQAYLLLAFLLLLCGWLLSQLHYREDIADFLPQDKATAKYTSVYNSLGGQNKIVVIFSSEEGDTESISKAIDDFGTLWKETDLADQTDLQTQIDDSQMMTLFGFILNNYPYFLGEEDYARMDSLLSIPNYVTNQLERNKTLLMLPTSGVMVHSLPYDPLHLFDSVLQRLQATNVGSDLYQLIDGYIFNKEADKGLAFLSSPYGISESMQNKLLSEQINTIIEKVKEKNASISISAIGAPLIAVTNAQQIRWDSMLSVTLSVLIIFSLLIYSFRQVRHLLWMALSVLFGGIFALGVISLVKTEISIIVLGIGSVILGIAINYPLHFLDHLKHSLDSRTALKEIVIPLLVGNITTVSAFLCLLFLNAEAMCDLGLFGSMVLVGTILFVLVFLPLLVRKGRAVTQTPLLSRYRCVRLSDKGKQRLFIPILLMTLVLAYLSTKTSFDSDLQHINYITSQQKEDLKMLSTSIQQNDSLLCVYAVAEGRNIQEALANNELLIQKAGDDIPISVNGIQNFIPSEKYQAKHLQQWTDFWKEHVVVIDELKSESKRLGFSAQAFEPFIRSVSATYPLRDADYFDEIMQAIGKNYVITEDSLVRIVNYLKVPNGLALPLKESLNTINPTSFFAFDVSDVSNQLVRILSDDFNYVGFLCGFIVFFFLWLSFGRLELSLLSFLPLAVSWFWILGIMYIFGIQFNIVNIILATFIFGQGDDYTIFITEGLMYEYAYGKKTLSSYKNSVALSAIIMFVGMGMMIFAKHPAIRSLAEVAIVGMFVVVLMAYYFPPLIFRWLTVKKGKIREIPLTLQRLSYSLFAMLFFLFGAYIVMIPFTFFYFRIGKNTEKKKELYHRILQVLYCFIVRHIPGVKFVFNNLEREDFKKPAMIISNHQSHLDVACILMLTPKLVIFTNDWVWHNPFYGMIIRHAEFYPMSDGLEINLKRMKSLVERGYSLVIFPEGTRSDDCSILRFHQGAFYWARELGIDILPIFLHGVGHVLPKQDFMLRTGEIYMEIGKRMTSSEQISHGSVMQLTSYYHKLYCSYLKNIGYLRENIRYYFSFVRHKYMYKGSGVERHCNKVLYLLKSKDWNDDLSGCNVVWIMNSGQGELAWLLALVYKETCFYAFDSDEDNCLLAQNTSAIPKNLHFIHLVDDFGLSEYPAADKTIDANLVLYR